MNSKGVFKFLLMTSSGLAIFLVKLPCIEQSAFQWFVACVEHIADPFGAEILLVFLSIAFLATLGGTVFRWEKLKKNARLWKTVSDCPMQLFTLGFAVAIVLLGIFFPSLPISEESAPLISACTHMLIFMISAKMILPLVSECGLSEFLEIYLCPIMKPLLHVPGSAVIHLLTSMLVSVNMAVVTVIEQFQKAVYNRRETTVIISCLMIPPMTFVMLALNNVGSTAPFALFYCYLIITSLVVSAIIVRIFPITTIPETYCGTLENKTVDDETGSKFQRAMGRAAEEAAAMKYRPLDLFFSILLNMVGFIPYILAWGTIFKLILNRMTVVQLVSYPYAIWLQLFGMSDAFQYAPLSILNFVDLVLPTLMLSDVADPSMTLKILCMNLGEIVYLAPLLLTVKCKNLISLPTLLIIWLLRLFLIVPVAIFLFPLTRL